MYFVQLIVKPALDTSVRPGVATLEVAIRATDVVGRSLADVASRLPDGVQILVVRAGGENRHPEPGLILAADDVLLLGGGDASALESARQMLGEHAPGRVVDDRSTLDHLRVFVSRPQVVGVPVSDLPWPKGVVATITHVQRGDHEMLVTPGLTLQPGDRVGLLTARSAFPAVRAHFGNSIRGTAEFSYVSLGIGMVLGVILGTIPVPVPGLGTFKLGIAGGSLMVALVLGRLGRTGSLSWTMPLSANLTLRNFGLSVFLAQVGMSSGAPFVRIVGDGGAVYLVAGACLLLALALTPLLVGHYVMRVPFDDLLGITSGVTGSPAILAYAYRSLQSERVEICYAMIYPSATIVKIVIAQVLIGAGAGP
jgi:putative transport protein